MWKKKQAVEMFSQFSFSPAHLRDAVVEDDTFQDGGTAPFACSDTYSFFFVCVYTDSHTVAAAASLISLQHATVSFDGTGKPATNQDKCY